MRLRCNGNVFAAGAQTERPGVGRPYRPGFWGPSHAGGAGPTPLSNGIVAEPDARRADFLLRSAPQGREQGAELLLDGRLVRVLKRGGDLRAQHVAVAAAEPLHRKKSIGTS